MPTRCTSASAKARSTLAQVAGAIQRRLQERARRRHRARTAAADKPGKASGLMVDGVGDLMSTIARCCRPVPPEAIAGYITLGRGVSIHRADCANLLRLRDAQPLRVLAVDWGGSSPERTFPASIRIEAFDRRGLVRDISAVLADEHISIEAMNTVTNSAENTATVDVDRDGPRARRAEPAARPLRRRRERDQRDSPSLSAAPRIRCAVRRSLPDSACRSRACPRASAASCSASLSVGCACIVRCRSSVLARILHREHGLGDQLAGHRADDVHAEDLVVVGRRDHLAEAGRRFHRAGAAAGHERERADLVRRARSS